MSNNVIVYTGGKVFHAWDLNSRARDNQTVCGRRFRYESAAHHWGPRSMFAEYFTPCRHCFGEEGDDETA